MKKIALKKVEKEYKKWMGKMYNKGQPSNVAEIVKFSLILFQEIKMKDIAIDDNADTLLFQYGTYDWGNGKFFEFDITRQFIKPYENKPYQLSMTFYFEPIECNTYDCWNSEFESLEKWAANIKKSKGYKAGKKLKPIKFEIKFEKC